MTVDLFDVHIGVKHYHLCHTHNSECTLFNDHTLAPYPIPHMSSVGVERDTHRGHENVRHSQEADLYFEDNEKNEV